MRDFYNPNKSIELDQDDLYETKPDGLFHIGQSYENKEAETVYCKGCGGTVFNVGQGDYYTAIKCVNCAWERCIHEG